MKTTLLVCNALLARAIEEFKNMGFDIAENKPMPERILIDSLSAMPSVMYESETLKEYRDDQYYLQRPIVNGKRKRNPNRWK